jgi:hypothetical protein
MRHNVFPIMSLSFVTTARVSLRALSVGLLLATSSLFAADAPAVAPAGEATAPARAASGMNDEIVSTSPMEVESESTGAHGQLVVAKELISPDNQNDLVYTITSEPLNGRVGLAGIGEDTDFFQNKTSHLGYFAYRPKEE